MKSIAKLLQDFFNHLFGKKKNPQQEGPIVYVTEGMAFTKSTAENTILIVNSKDDCDDEEEIQPIELDRVEIMKRIKQIIKSENKKKPYSDVEIAGILRQEGVIISRRTVCNYRDNMDIEPRKERLEDYEKAAEKRKKRKDD